MISNSHRDATFAMMQIRPEVLKNLQEMIIKFTPSLSVLNFLFFGSSAEGDLQHHVRLNSNCERPVQHCLCKST